MGRRCVSVGGKVELGGGWIHTIPQYQALSPFEQEFISSYLAVAPKEEVNIPSLKCMLYISLSLFPSCSLLLFHNSDKRANSRPTLASPTRNERQQRQQEEGKKRKKRGGKSKAPADVCTFVTHLSKRWIE